MLQLEKHITPLNYEQQLIDTISDEIESVLLGECTHGTHEFYDIRSEMTKLLVKNRKFNIILLESDWTNIWRINNYINHKSDDKYAIDALSDIKKILYGGKIILQLI